MIRFKKDDGSSYSEWETKKLSDIFKHKKISQCITDDAPLLSFTIEQGVIDPSEKKTNKRDFLIKDKDNKKYQRTDKEDIIYNPANIKYGAIHRNKLGTGVVSPIYVILTTSQNPIFMEYLVRRDKFIKNSQRYLEGTVEKLRTLKAEDFLKLEVSVPCLEEQQKIADFLSLVDDVITASEQEVANLEEQKKGVMQKIFSQEVRFKADDGSDYPEWEEKRLKDICKYNSSQVSAGDVLEDGKYELYDANSKIGYIDICLPVPYVSIIKDGSGVGKTRLLKENTYCIGTMGMITSIDDSYIYYIYYLLKTIRFDKYVVGGAIPHIYFKDYGKTKILVPCLEEQKKIADFLSDMDTAIDLAKQELEQWKELKKGLLQQLFE